MAAQQASVTTAQATASIDPSQYTPHGTISVPLARALPDCKPATRPDLTADQAKKYDDLLRVVSEWKDIPSTAQKAAVAEPLSDTERLWLSRDCLLRYLRATSWASTDAAAKRLLATLTWRREYGLAKFTPEYISPENETGKQTIFGFDNEARPCHYLNPGKQNTAPNEKQNQHLVYMLERNIDIMGPGQETIALLINYKHATSSKSPPMSQSREVLNILQTHYPERLGRALMTDMPWYITTFFKLISPFIDPVTKTKMKFNEALTRHVPPVQLLKEFGGQADFVYDHAQYWPALTALAERRRKDYQGRWEKAGSRVGESEFYLRGGDGPSISGEHRGTDFAEGAFA